MSQAEIIDWLVMKRKDGSNKFYSTTEIQEGLRRNGQSYLTVRRSVFKLFVSGFLDMEQEGFNNRRYRVKQKYVGVRA